MTIRTVKTCLNCGKEATVNKTEKKPYCPDCAFKNLMNKLDVTPRKFGIKEAWLLNDKGEKTLSLGNGCYIESPLDNKEIVYEDGVAVVRGAAGVE